MATSWPLVKSRLSTKANDMLDAMFQRNWRLFAVFFIFILALKWSFLTIPPVWDEAFSIFPAADFLVKNNFDYALLLEQPRYNDGGPTAHALSLMTLVTALVLKATGGGTPAWIVLHTLQFLMGAAIGTILTRIYANVFDKMPAFLLTVASLTYPLVLAQLGMMYLEVPVLFFTLVAFSFFLKSRIWLASLFLVAACMTKGSALIGVGALAMTAFFYQNKPLVRRLLDVFILAVPSIAFIKVLMNTIGKNAYLTLSHSFLDIVINIINKNIFVYRAYISIVPELIVIFSACIIFSIFYILKYFKKETDKKNKVQATVLLHSFLVIIFFIFYFLIHNYINKGAPHFLTRYTAYAIPSMFFVIYYIHDQILQKHHIKIFILLLFISLFIFNRNGILYPQLNFTCNAMTERSEEYLNGYLIQKKYIALIEEKVPRDVPIFVSRPDYFLTQYPVSQYVNNPLTNVQFILHIVDELGTDFPYPDHFVLVYSYPWGGGEHIKQIYHNAYMSKDYSVRVLGHFTKGSLSAQVYEVLKNK